MRIQRWRESEVMIADNEHGWWVKYDDHVAAMEAEAESAHDLGVIYGINHERARIKAAVQALGQQHPKWDAISTHYPDCWKNHSECALTLVLAIIDGEKDWSA